MTSAEEIIATSGALLLDFDGPITALMPPPLNARAAERARAALQHISLPIEIRTTTDHLAVLRYAAEHQYTELGSVESACSAAEIECARVSEPSPEVQAILNGATGRSVPVAVVSNNSEDAVKQFLHRFGWAESIRVLSCRTPSIALKLKPDPFLVEKAVALLGVDAADCVFIGDSVTDVEAGNAAGVRVVGLAKNAERGRQLFGAGAVAIIER